MYRPNFFHSIQLLKIPFLNIDLLIEHKIYLFQLSMDIIVRMGQEEIHILSKKLHLYLIGICYKYLREFLEIKILHNIWHNLNK